MREDIAGPQGASSRPMWETLEGMVREKAQEFIQQIMEEEVTELLGREKSERRSTVDSAEGYRNGYGKPRRLAMSSGTITLRRPRVRGVEERFESRVLPLFARRTKELGALLPELYLHGLAEGDFELAMRGLLGEGAPLSKSSIRRLRAGWTAWYPKAVDALEDDWERMVAFYDFPEDHWKHLRTTNVVESPFAAVRLRTTAAKRFKRVESATALIWKLLLVAEKRFRRLDAPHLLKDVFEGRKFEDGKPVSTQQRKNAA